MLSRRRLSLVLGFALSVGSPHYAGAQVARWSFDLAVGGASVDGGEYLNNGRAAARLSAANRLLQRGRFGVYAEVGYDWVGTFGLLGANPDLVCIVESASGRCEPPFPDVAGPSASIGLLYAPRTWVETRAGVGGAAYSVDGTRIGATVGQLDASLVPAAHLGLTLGARFVVIPRYRHDRLTMVPLLIGLRVQ